MHDNFKIIIFAKKVSLFCSKREQILPVEKIENKKGNESDAVSRLPDIPDLKGAVPTLDALHCKKNSKPNRSAEKSLCRKVKGNRPKLMQALEETIICTEPIACHMEEEIVRGRLEIRQTWLYERQDNLAEGWESINRIASVHRIFLSNSKEHKTDSIYITDLQTNDAKYIAEGIRSHWGIENRLHCTKDVIMREDAECTKDRQAAANLALFRDFAFNILKTKHRSIKCASEIFANCNPREIFNILVRT